MRDTRYVILVLCPRGIKLRKVGNPTVTPSQITLTSNIFALNIISATKFVPCSSLVQVYECLKRTDARARVS